MTIADYKVELRKEVRDDHGTQWSDGILDGIIRDSWREYCIGSDRYVKSMAVVGNGRGVYELPEGFIRGVRFEDASGIERPFLPWTDLDSDLRRRVGGAVEGVVMRYDGPRQFRLFPQQTAVGETLGTLWYSCVEDIAKLPEADEEAIKEYCLFRMMLLDGKGTYKKHYDKWLSIINSSYAGADTIRNRRVRFGRFF